MGHREAILESATKLFREKGFSRTTADEIAADARITKRTMYRYVDSKEAVLLAIHEEFLGRLLKPVDLGGPMEEQFAALVKNYVETVVIHRDEIRVFFEERKHLSPESLARVVTSRDAHEATFRSALCRGIEDGTFRNVDIPLATEGVLGTIASMYEWYRPDGVLQPQQMAHLITYLFFRGIVPALGTLPTPADPGTKQPPEHDPPAIAALERSLDDAAWNTNPVMGHILDVAANLFYKQGYDKTSTRELAEVAGLTKSALYYYIPNKESVLFQINLKLTVEGNHSIRQIIGTHDDPVETLRSIVIWHCETVAANLGALRALNYQMRFLNDEHYAEIRDLRREYSRLFCDSVRAACPSSTPPSYADAVALAILGMLNFMNEWYAPGGRSEPRQIGETFFDILWNGVAKNPPDRSIRLSWFA
ncbi:TetR family transcriptional regulator [Rhodococcus opacus]